MTEATLSITILTALTVGGGVVWTFMRGLYQSQELKIKELENRLNNQTNEILFLYNTLSDIISAVEYTDTINDEHNIKLVVKEIKLELQRRINEKNVVK